MVEPARSPAVPTGDAVPAAKRLATSPIERSRVIGDLYDRYVRTADGTEYSGDGIAEPVSNPGGYVYGLLLPGWIPASDRPIPTPAALFSNGTNTNSNSMFRFRFPSTMDEIRLVYANVGGTGAMTVRAGINTPANELIPVYFNGARNASIDTGVFTQTIISDPIPIKVLAGNDLFVRTKISVPSGTWGTQYQAYQASEWVYNEVGTTDLTTSTFPTANAGFGFGPILILGRPSGHRRWVAIMGDSIGTLGAQLATEGYTRNWRKLALGATVNFAAYGAGGAQLATLQAAGVIGAAAYMAGIGRGLAHGATDVLLFYGTNDWNAAGKSLAQLQAQDLTEWNYWRDKGKRVHTVTIPPYTTSSDSWATIGNQTIPNAPKEAIRIAFNDWRRSLPAPLYHCFDVADKLETTRNSGWWLPGLTADGVHPAHTSGNGTVALASAFDPTVFT